MNLKTTLAAIILCSFFAKAQVGVNEVNPQASLDVVASNIATPANNDGILIPRINAFPATNPTATQQSMLVYLTTNLTGVNISGTAQNYAAGFYYWENSIPNWISLQVTPSDDWTLDGNAGTTNGTNFLGTTDSQALDIRTNNVIRARFTTDSKIEILNSGLSVYIGENAGAADPTTVDKQNVMIGTNAGQNITTGAGSFFEGAFSTGVGYSALANQTTANRNTAVGNNAALNTTTGNFNVAVGQDALRNAVDADYNTAIGQDALENIEGDRNTAVGYRALSGQSNPSVGTGQFNTAIGQSAGLRFQDGDSNVWVGSYVDQFNNDGDRNTVIGSQAGASFGSARDLIGRVLIGYQAGSTLGGADNTLYIENSDSETPLIYGEFDNDILRIGGQLQIGNSDDATIGSQYTFPRTAGTNGQILQLDAAGDLNWANNASDDWSLLGNAGTTAANFLGTTDGQALNFRTNNTERFRVPNADQVHAMERGTQALPFYSWEEDTNSGMWLVQGDELAFGAGNLEFMRFRERAQDELVINLPGQNIDFRVESDAFDDLLFLDASTDQVSIGNNTPVFAIDTFQSYAYFLNDHAVNGYSQSGVGVYGADASDGIGVEGVASATGIGVSGAANATGIVSIIPGAGGTFTGDRLGILARSEAINTPGILASANGAALNSFGGNEGVAGNGSFSGITGLGNGTGSIGVLGGNITAGALAAVFANGDLTATGAKAFTIDHPLDPENKILKHFSIESDEVLNVYRGTTTFDVNGEATINLPSYFASINVNYSYQLTAVGAAMPNIYVAEEVSNNTFKVAGGLTGKKVSWTVFANRNDAYVQSNPDRVKPEQNKTGDLKGKYLDHKSWNQPENKAYFKLKTTEPTKLSKGTIQKTQVPTKYNNGPNNDKEN